MSIEADIKRMEQITAKLKDNETPLDEAITLFEEGVKIARTVEEQLTEMERKVEILVNDPEDETSETPHLEPFSDTSGR